MVRTQKKVLAVDDNPVNLEIISEALRGDYRVRFAENGKDAIQIAISFRPDIVLLDVMMPGMDGLETCRQLRNIAGLENCLVVMVSAKAMPSEKAAGLRAGADAYITKPFDENVLLTLLQRLCEVEGRCVDVQHAKSQL